MFKKAGYLKTLKKMKDFFGKGLTWVNNNIVKPLKPIINNALEMTPYGDIGKIALETGSNLIDNFGYNNDPNVGYNNFGKVVEQTSDIIMDSQRAPRDRKYNQKYKNPFGGVIN